MNEPLEIDRCPTSAELLQALEDPSSSTAAAVLTHVRWCARCRHRHQRFNAALGDYAIVAGGGSPNAAHLREREFLRRMRDQSRKQARIHARAARWTKARWIPIAAMIPLLIALTAAYWPSATLEAEELLERAALSEQSRPAGWAQKVLVRVTATDAPRASTTHAAVRLAGFAAEVEIGDGLTFDLAASAGTTRDADALLTRLFAGHQLDLREPLSIARIRAWRATLTHKRETVTPVDADTLRLHITTDEGALSDVDVVVHNVSYGVINQTLVFRDIVNVEITAKGPQAIRVRPATQASGSGYKAAPTPIAPPAPAPPALAELRPVEPPPLFGGAAIPHAALSRWLDANVIDKKTRDDFVPELVRRVTAVKRDLYTMQALARRTPPAASPLAAQERADLSRQVGRQARALATHLDALASHMALFGTMNRADSAAGTPPNWRKRTTTALSHFDEFERQLADLLRSQDVPRDELGQPRLHPANEAFVALFETWHARPTR